MSEKDDLYTLARRALERAKKSDDESFSKPLADLKAVIERIGKSWSGSWLGYQSRVYYENFNRPPPGARFSQEWGFRDAYSIPSTTGNWQEYAFDDVVAHIMHEAGNPDIDALDSATDETREFFEEAHSTLLSKLSNSVQRLPDDKFLADLLEQAKKVKLFDASDFVNYWKPSGQLISRDMLAIEKGLNTPPHLSVLARAMAAEQPFHACKELGKIAQRVASHLTDQEQKSEQQERIGTNVFIGHGRASAWKDLRDFIRDRLHLPWDEFNRVPIAGVTNIARLSQMLDGATIAFLIMTAEDEQADGKLRARMNVVHEAGLFQGRLGFERAIVLLEDGCEEFSNIQGLGQIRFPKGNISAVFEEIRLVLEREGLIE